MGKFRKSYHLDFKLIAVNLYLEDGLSYDSVAKELSVGATIIKRWVKHYKSEGIKGLEEKRGRATGIGKGRPRVRPEDPESKIKRLEAENAILQKLLQLGKGE